MTLALGWGLLGSIVFGLFVLVYAYQHYLKRPFVWQQTFLYELLFFTYPIPPRLSAMFIWIGSLGIGYFTTLFYEPNDAILTLLWTCSVLWFMSSVVIGWIPIRRTTMFLAWHVGWMIVTMMLLFLAAYVVRVDGRETLPSWIQWTSIVQALFQAGLLLNPRLKTWYQLRNVSDNKEKPLYERPRWFVLAYSEWFTFFNGLIWIVLLQLQILIG